MDSKKKAFFDDAVTTYDTMDEEPSQMEIPEIENTGIAGSLSIMMSQSKKIRRKLSQAPRVVFADTQHEQDTTRGVSSDEESIVETIASDSKANEQIAMTEVDEESLGTDMEDETFRKIQVESKRQLGSQPEIPRPLPSASKSGEGENIASIKRSTIFLGYTIDEMLAQYHQTSQQADESEPSTDMESMIRTAFGGHTHFSKSDATKRTIFEVSQADRLSPLEAKAFVVVLQEALDVLRILEHVIPAKVDKRWDEGYQTIDEKYGAPKEPEIIFREDLGLLPLIPTLSEKLQRDRTYMYNVLKGTIRDLQCVRRFDRLETEVDDIARILEGERNLEVNNEIWTAQVKQLRQLIESERLENEQEINNLLLLAHDMDAEIDNATFSNNSKLDFVERWEDARLDQQKLRLEIKEQEINDALEECARVERIDQIVSGEVRTFLQANTNDIEQEIGTWATRHNEEIERLQRETNEMTEKIELQKLDLQKLQDLSDEQDFFFDQYYAEKELAEREAEYWEAVSEAATLIQSVWRGYMVRHELGAFEKLRATLEKKKKKKTRKKPKKRGKKGKK